jgi:formylglycine-generating enzyme required for sulfatase activity
MAKFLISHRRDDAQGPAERLYHALWPMMRDPRKDIVFGVGSPPAGQSAFEHVDRWVAQCEILLAVIGNGWLTARDPKKGGRALDNRDDLVRLQIASALRQGKKVVPILVDGVGMPIAGMLPDEIKALAQMNSVELRRLGFESDVSRMLKGLGIGVSAGAPRQGWWRRRMGGQDPNVLYQSVSVLLGGAVLLGGGFGFYVIDPFKWWRDGYETADRLSLAAANEDAARTIAKQACDSVKKQWNEGLSRSSVRGDLEELYRSTPSDCDLADKVLARLEHIQPLAASLRPAINPGEGDAAGGKADGAVFRDCVDCPEMVIVPAGTFLMGPRPGEGNSWDGEVQTSATVKRIAVSRHEIAFVEHDACTASGGCGGLWLFDYGDGRGRRPVNVRYHEAKAYADWLSRHTGRTYRLLEEAEWEYAARGGTATRFYWGDDPNAACTYENLSDLALSEAPGEEKVNLGYVAGCNDGLGDSTAATGSYRANPFGLHDMLGNRPEWVTSCEGDDPVSPDRCASHIARAGGYVSGPQFASVTRREPVAWNSRGATIRLAREID